MRLLNYYYLVRVNNDILIMQNNFYILERHNGVLKGKVLW